MEALRPPRRGKQHECDRPGARLTESLTLTCNGTPVTADEIIGNHGTCIHRFAAAEKFFGLAATEFEEYVDSETLLEKVSIPGGTRLSYVPGSGDPIGGAADTVLVSAGVCRDYARRDAADTAFLDNYDGVIMLKHMRSRRRRRLVAPRLRALPRLAALTAPEDRRGVLIARAGIAGIPIRRTRPTTAR